MSNLLFQTLGIIFIFRSLILIQFLCLSLSYCLLHYLMLVCPPKSHTWNFKFLYTTVSTLKPIAERKQIYNYYSSTSRLSGYI